MLVSGVRERKEGRERKGEKGRDIGKGKRVLERVKERV